MSNGSAMSPTVAAPVASRARMARRVGSASAEKVWESASIFNILVKYKPTPRQVITRDVIAGSRPEPYESAPHVRS
jgi:hypothetical protein